MMTLALRWPLGTPTSLLIIQENFQKALIVVRPLIPQRRQTTLHCNSGPKVGAVPSAYDVTCAMADQLCFCKTNMVLLSHLTG